VFFDAAYPEFTGYGKEAKMETNAMTDTCQVCGLDINECICCPECGHICALDEGELYCSVCSPPLPGSETGD
jgi:hypothetical protein